jgi:hypothetical protein
MSYFEESTKLGSLPSWIDPFDFGKHTPVIIKTTIPAVVKDVTNTAGDQTIDLTQAKALIAKYGAARAYQVIKGTKTIAQADAEIAALKPVVQSSGIVNTVVNIVKSNWLLFAIGGVLLFFGPSLFKSRR